MERDTLYNVMLNKEALAGLPVDDLQQLVLRFPYFQAARILLLKKMKEEDCLGFERELKKSSVFIGDRAKLFVFLHSYGSSVAKENALPELSLITTNGERDESVSASYVGSTDTTFNYLFLSEDEARTVNQEEILKSESELIKQEEEMLESDGDWNLIDQFMSSGSKKLTPVDDERVPQGNLAESSVRENPTVLTETLAKIYIKQKKYDKAIAIFESLSLKFPNKNAYFAARIEELKILIKSS